MILTWHKLAESVDFQILEDLVLGYLRTAIVVVLTL